MVSKKSETTKPKGKRYTSELPDQVKLDRGDSFQGIFVSMKTTTITDLNTREPKDVMVYTFKNDTGAKVALLGRAALDRIFEEIHEDIGDKLIGRELLIERGEDKSLQGGRSLGQYDITVLDSFTQQ